MELVKFLMVVLLAARVEDADVTDGEDENTNKEMASSPDIDAVTASANFSGEDPLLETGGSGSDRTEDEEDKDGLLDASSGKNETQNATSPNKSLLRKIRCKPRGVNPWPLQSDTNESVSLNEKSKEFLKNMEDHLVNEVKLVNGSFMTRLFSEKHNPNITNKSTPADCHLVMFYAPWCPFSAAAAPHFNALAKLYPDVALMAVDSSKHQGVNTQFGILAIPTLILFHNSKAVSKFNHSEYNIHNFVEYVDTFTHLKPAGEVEVTEEDKVGPLPTVATEETDYYLYLAWLFTVVCAIGYFGRSSFCAKIVEAFRNNWREAEIQHEHID